MKDGVITLHQYSGDIVGKVKISLKFDISEEMMQMFVSDISKAIEHWQDRIVYNSHNN